MGNGVGFGMPFYPFCIGTIDPAFSEPHPPVTIAFASNIDGNWDIYLTDTVGQIPVNLTFNPAADYYPSWSPDGTQIAFSQTVMATRKYM